jgi:hypothetical protein
LLELTLLSLLLLLSLTGRNAYYYAHAKSANGPKWDGNIEPKLLSSTPIASSETAAASELAAAAASSPVVAAESMKGYAWADDGTKVKIYVDLSNIGEHSEEKIILVNTELSFSLTVLDYAASGSDGENETKEKNLRLKINTLFAAIEKCTMKVKENKIIVTLKKSDGDQSWPCLGKGTPSS